MPETYGPVEAVHKITYADNVKLALQQKESRLKKTFSYIPGLKGIAMQAVELVGPGVARVDGSENSDTPNMQPNHKGIYVKPRRVDWGQLIPRSTAIKAAVEYQSTYVQTGASAVARGHDKVLVDAIFGPRLVVTDEAGIGAPSIVAFDTATQQIPVNYGAGGNTNLTVKKIVHAVSMMIDAEIDVDAEPVWCLITGKQNESLYSELQVTSKDYRNKAQFDEKRVMSFMNVNFEYFTGIPKDANGYRRIPIYPQSAMHYGDAMPVTTMIDQNVQKQYQPHPYIDSWIGATRSEDAKVVEILCAEA